MYSGHQEYIDNPDSLLLSSSRNMSGIGGLVPQQQQTPPSFHMHPQQQQQQQNSFGPMTISPPNHNIGAPFQDPSTQWFGTSLESNGSSFGQSPVFGTKDLLVTPSSSTGHLMEGYSGPENGDGIQRR
jgi:hypothetical protein